ncbi:M61 family metallopeptidase [Kordiimonas sp. SCSIO 12610]|uniref:M61 family metallopeptidase n=1 Tax=Kordiimonas sp. SCSIO 12610 TaxID=2829597 RepID=UPI00210DBB8E|nr:PDZ domain-containing protein [Kordiimonas sp. SCSIO 12610]UTW56243.1 M61 family metallopeptidase [Kordiimonas sp. SCSIO 12610]
MKKRLMKNSLKQSLRLKAVSSTAAAALTTGLITSTAFNVAAASTMPAQETGGAPISYEVSFKNAVHHEAEITVTYRDVGAAVGDGPLEVRMSRSSPGRYAIHEFAKNVYAVSATDAKGNPLKVTRDDPYSWNISGHRGGTVKVTYTLFGDRADGTYTQIDLTHAHMNMPATFMWAKGMEDRTIDVLFKPEDPSWKVATQLRPTSNPYLFEAPNLQYFMDSPTELSDFDLREWKVEDLGGVKRTIRLAVHHDGTSRDMDMYAKKAKAVVAEQIKLFGDVPNFDYETYTFIADYLPHVSGDGMEHRNSTILTSSRSLYDSDFSQLGTLSHEFIHAWNVERLRPQELEPFNFERTNPTPSLWLAEGFTSYYGPLTIRRAGEETPKKYISSLSRQLNGIVNAAGRKFDGPQQMSLRAAFVDAATSIDPTNNSNIFTSYYPYGAIVGLALDLEIRGRFKGKSLDDVMRRLWETNGAPEKPYAPDALIGAVAHVTGDQAFADAFFKDYIADSGLPDFASLFERAGIVFQKKNEGKAYLGRVRLNGDGEIRGNVIKGTPLYAAGLERGDEILKIGSRKIRKQGDLDKAIGRYAPGDTVTISFLQRGAAKTAEVTFASDPTVELVMFEDADRKPSKKQLKFREAWMGKDS